MKINDVLEQFNKILDEKRKEINSDNTGHFVSTTSLDSGFGTQKICEVKIEYYSKGNLTPIIYHISKGAIPSALVDSFTDDTRKIALKKFFSFILDNFDNYIEKNDTRSE